jgi:hypothetical protein
MNEWICWLIMFSYCTLETTQCIISNGGMLFHEWVSVSGEHEWWTRSCEQEGIFSINFVHVKNFIFNIFYLCGKMFPNTIEYFSMSPTLDILEKGSMHDFLWGFMRRFVNRFCGCWNKFNCFDLWSHFAICKRFKVTSPM